MNTKAISTRLAAVLLALALLVVAVGCGGSDDSPDRVLKVSAAASLQEAFEEFAEDFEEAEDVDVQLQFAGSDALAAQIQEGARPGVFAAANTKLPDALHEEGLLDQPEIFATNELVIAVPDDSDIRSLDDLTADGVKIAAGAESVPVGTYTRKVLSELPRADERAILDNIRSSEPDVKGVVGKVAADAVDAGFVYATDVKAVEDKLTAIALPDELSPVVKYGIGVVTEGSGTALARSFIEQLLAPAGQEILKAEGFGGAPAT